MDCDNYSQFVLDCSLSSAYLSLPAWHFWLPQVGHLTQVVGCQSSGTRIRKHVTLNYQSIETVYQETDYANNAGTVTISLHNWSSRHACFLSSTTEHMHWPPLPLSITSLLRYLSVLLRKRGVRLPYYRVDCWTHRTSLPLQQAVNFRQNLTYLTMWSPCEAPWLILRLFP